MTGILSNIQGDTETTTDCIRDIFTETERVFVDNISFRNPYVAILRFTKKDKAAQIIGKYDGHMFKGKKLKFTACP